MKPYSPLYKNIRVIIALFGAVSLLSLGAAHSAAADEKSAPAKSAQAVKKVDVEEFDKLRQVKTNIVLDVRSEKEFQAGHIPGAVNLDVNSADFDKKMAALDKSRTYLVHCAAGVRSAKACSKMEGGGFPMIYELPAGFRGWEKAGKPVEK